MHINPVNNSYNPSSKGLYFSNIPAILLNKRVQINPSTGTAVKTSEHGFQYIEDSLINNNIRERFASIPFIKELSEKFDTFIFFREMPLGDEKNLSNINCSFARIIWTNAAGDQINLRKVTGTSPLSQELATAKMFDNLKKKNFSEIN